MEEKKVPWYKKTWRWFDGKKTSIGTAMMIVSGAFKPYTIAHSVLYYGGALLGGSGVVHKVQKGDYKNRI